MALTPETLPRHELNGLPVRVVESDDASRVGLAGRVVIETTKTLSIEVRRDGESRVVMVPKSGSTFEFAITDDAADDRRGTLDASRTRSGNPRRGRGLRPNWPTLNPPGTPRIDPRPRRTEPAAMPPTVATTSPHGIAVALLART